MVRRGCDLFARGLISALEMAGSPLAVATFPTCAPDVSLETGIDGLFNPTSFGL